MCGCCTQEIAMNTWKHGIAIASLAFAACSGEDSAAPRGDDERGISPPEAAEPMLGDRRVPFAPPDDRAFIEFFADHQRTALELTQQELMRGDNAEVRALAQRMHDELQATLETAN